MLFPRKFTLKDRFSKLRRVFLLAVVAVAPAALSACSGLPVDERGASSTIQDPDDSKFEASDEAYRLGVEQFVRGHYGNAQKYFQESIEKSPLDAARWISLAACYDHLRRFDLADEAYDRALVLEGESVSLLNNQGYSYVLRGDMNKARKKFMEALKRDPDNLMARNNLQRIDEREAASRQAQLEAPADDFR